MERSIRYRKSGNLLSDSWGASDESRSGIQQRRNKYQTGLYFCTAGLWSMDRWMHISGRDGRASDCRMDLQRAVLQVLLLLREMFLNCSV